MTPVLHDHNNIALSRAHVMIFPLLINKVCLQPTIEGFLKLSLAYQQEGLTATQEKTYSAVGTAMVDFFDDLS